MTVRCDAAIVGAGADGLAAAAILAGRGLKVVVIERGDRPGGLLATLEFHPGFRASPYADEIPAIPPPILWQLDLARRGASFAPIPHSVARWQDREHGLSSSPSDEPLLRRAAGLRAAIVSHMEKLPRSRWTTLFRLWRRHAALPLPGESWWTCSLHDILAEHAADEDMQAHLASLVLGGRSADPFLAGSALHLLAPASASSGVVMGGLGSLADALTQAALQAGAEIRCGLDASELKLDSGRIAGLALVDGTELETRAVISTLDLRRTFLSLFAWQVLPAALLARTGTFRMAGATARVLMALQSPPPAANPPVLRGLVHLAPSLGGRAAADLAWRAGCLAPDLPATLHVASALDPSLAPPGAAVMTVTLGAVPFRLFDGAWTKEKRDLLRQQALRAANDALPGTADRVIAAEVITPCDMADALGATEGDLWGGEIAADQMLDFRPGGDPAPPRTPIRGLYLAGPSTPLGPIASCASGARAAAAVLYDMRR